MLGLLSTVHGMPAHWLVCHDGTFTPDDAYWPFTVDVTCEITSFLASLHWLTSEMDR